MCKHNVVDCILCCDVPLVFDLNDFYPEKGCRHEPGQTPLVLKEKQFETWIICKKCGNALSKV